MWTLLSVAAFFVSLSFGDCPGQNLLPRPDLPHETGPWPVGARTVTLPERNMTCEIWYPAKLGSEVGEDIIVYWMRDEHLPPLQRNKIPDDESPAQPCDCYRDLPLDESHGPYPVHIHIHGTAGFRQISMHQMTHFASRGFVTVACDHPGIRLLDLLSVGTLPTDQTGDARRTIEALKKMEDPQLRFLDGFIDMTKIAVSGHSAGGGAVRPLGDVAQVVMPWAGGGVLEGPELKSAGVFAGEWDGYNSRRNSYNQAPAPKRFFGVERAGHAFCTDLCWIGMDDGGIVEIALRNDVYAAALLAPLIGDSCEKDSGAVFNEPAWDIVNYGVAGMQEEVLFCDDTMAEKLANIDKNLPHVLEYLEE